ncbi:uncharacterized protein A4U43_C04F19030 [Asparagus officinalis]|uniref:Chromatin assembly factor 1 subunit FAS1 n=1 Tax=Asparagus officinalis TaxID=4686 RepID=A0A5P1F7C3_ASPOF|nr:chromatin assembly factor 1 subunit FSM [Asparagus officinalis]ONK72400.1 uncharacterized protein A4U43_C04F19030 [Asparagus officinalis]
MGDESVLVVQVEDLNRSKVSDDKMVRDDSEECKKDCVEGTEDQPKVDDNTMIVEGSKLAGSNRNHEITVDNSLVGALKQSQGVTKSNEKGVGKQAKRKRASIDVNVLSTDKGTLVTECRRELDSLFEYYKELSARVLTLEEGLCSSNNSLVACLLEESNLAFSKLVEVIFEKLKGKEGVSLAYVRSTVLSVAHRISYGITNVEADVLEDESAVCLWCWETKDIKLIPPNQRADLNVRRIGRKKIHERISALSATLSALAIPENQASYKSILNKTSIKLGKALNLEEIRSLVEKKKQKSNTSMADKTAKLKEKESIRAIQKEKLQTEKEIKRMQEEAEKEAKQREKDEAESKKQLKKQQEEAERDRRRREREEAELKKQRSVKKQATIMERFLKTKKSNDNSHSIEKPSPKQDPISDSPNKVEVVNATTSLMDSTFYRQDSSDAEDLRKLHVDGWRKLSRCNRSCHWGVRRNPRAELFKELKLHESSIEVNPLGKPETPVKEVASPKDFSREVGQNKLGDDGSERSFGNDHIDIASLQSLRKKLLQFDKSNRPAYYGTWSKKSCAVGPRRPLKMDPDLNYDVDSDEEWEEEEPGESLSDCDKDVDEERLEEETLKFDDEEESEDGFFVPDGYLSENEGVQVDGKSGGTDGETGSSQSGQSAVESEEIRVLLQQQKYLQNLTQQALRKVHPLVISNLAHEKSETKTVEDINGTSKIEQMCLQALSMRACPGGCIIDLSVDYNPENEDQEVPQSQAKNNTTPTPSTSAILDSDLPEIVLSIRSNSQGINKVLESLQGKFPTTPKSQLRNKVKEIADYVDNRWQVKKEILDRLGLSTSPEKLSKPKGITTFFSKRCLPPQKQSVDASESSPQQCSKTKVIAHDGTQCSGV